MGKQAPYGRDHAAANDMMVEHLANISDNSASKNLSQRASRLARTPEKVTPSEPPSLNEDTPIGKPDHEREYMTELGENIRKLTELMRLPQRSINNGMREVLGNSSNFHAYAQQRYHSLNKKQSSMPKGNAEEI